MRHILLFGGETFTLVLTYFNCFPLSCFVFHECFFDVFGYLEASPVYVFDTGHQPFSLCSCWWLDGCCETWKARRVVAFSDYIDFRTLYSPVHRFPILTFLSITLNLQNIFFFVTRRSSGRVHYYCISRYGCFTAIFRFYVLASFVVYHTPRCFGRAYALSLFFSVCLSPVSTPR